MSGLVGSPINEYGTYIGKLNSESFKMQGTASPATPALFQRALDSKKEDYKIYTPRPLKEDS